MDAIQSLLDSHGDPCSLILSNLNSEITVLKIDLEKFRNTNLEYELTS